MRSPGPPFIVSSRGPRSNTLTASPYPVRATTSTAAFDLPTFSSLLLCGTQWEHSCVPHRHSCRCLVSAEMSLGAARKSVPITADRVTILMNIKDLPAAASLTFEGACATRHLQGSGHGPAGPPKVMKTPSGADPLVRAGPPWTRSSGPVYFLSRPTRAPAADQGVRPT
jgi:hypothetical protein